MSVVARPDNDLHRQIAQLREENEMLRETNRQIVERLTPDINFPRAWRLTPAETRWLSCLYSSQDGFRSKGALHVAASRNLYGETEEQVVNVIATRLRKKLPPEVVIDTIWGKGYHLGVDSRDFLATVIKVQKGVAK